MNDKLIKQIIIVAGGNGSRMKSNIPKQFIVLNGLPVLMRTINVFYKTDPEIDIILVLPHGQMNVWKGLCAKYKFSVPHVLVAGGNTRFQSVKNALVEATSEGLIGVHDGVRPFVSPEVICSCYDTAIEKKAVVPVIDVVETLRRLAPFNRNHTVPRSEFKLVQTPQVFDAVLLHEAYEQPYSSRFTDDASVVEATGMSITLVPGNRNNIKLTTPIDLKIAETLIRND